MGDFIRCNVDLHVHGLYSMAVSREMVPKVIGEQAPLKGLDLVATGDCVHSKWIALLKQQLKQIDEGLLEHENGTRFILQTEVEDNNRVHHIILVPSFSKAEELREKLMKKCFNIDSDGRPSIRMNGEELAEACAESECLIGFSHAFTPYTGLYSKFNSYKECYGKYWKNVCFLELGLSADTNMADRISELHELTFTSNSDAHSPWPNKMGREFNTLGIKEITFDEVKKALQRKDGRKILMNVGFNPLEGKYHKTRCTGCLTFFEPKQASAYGWRCPRCAKPIKKGVDFRIEELATLPLGNHPEHRPGYRHIIPLSEIIALAAGVNNAWSIKVQEEWKRFVAKFGNEIDVLLSRQISELEMLDKNVATFVGYFRDEKISYVPGGAGVYGKLIPPGKEVRLKTYKGRQKTLGDF